MLFGRALLTLAAAASVALGATLPRSLPSGTVTCGSNKYTSSELTSAINAGINYMKTNNLQGKFKAMLKAVEML